MGQRRLSQWPSLHSGFLHAHVPRLWHACGHLSVQARCSSRPELLKCSPSAAAVSLSVPLLSHALFALDPPLASFPAFCFARHLHADAFRAAFFSSSLQYAHLRPRFLLVSPLASFMLNPAPDFEPE